MGTLAIDLERLIDGVDSTAHSWTDIPLASRHSLSTASNRPTMATSLLATVAAFAAAALPVVSADTGPYIFDKRATCTRSVESCSSSADSVSTCCVNRPGGQFLMTQFWDTDPVTGPTDSWTIHGLWPDNCDGTYDQYCDDSREYTNMSSLVEEYGSQDLLDYMNDYWQSNSESNEEFWEHEWAAHGTCVSTLETSCYTNYKTGQEAVDFFQVVVDLFKTLDTYTILSNAGIVPSSSKTYTSDEIISALTDAFGATPVIKCSNKEFYQVYYGFFSTGPLTDADFTASDIVGNESNCPTSGVKYLPKSGASTTTGTSTATATSTRTSSAATATGTSSVSGTGYWNAYYKNSKDGCLISSGTWYTTGTCATYHASSTNGGFTMYTSKGNCGVVDGVLSCGSGVSSGTFSVVNGLLAYDGQTTFYATSVPSGSSQSDVYVASKTYSSGVPKGCVQ